MKPLLVLALVAFGATQSFPPPVALSVDEGLKYSPGALVSVDDKAGTFIQATSAGPVTFPIGRAPVFSASRQPLAGLSALSTGQRVRVYFRLAPNVDVLEVDVEAPGAGSWGQQ